MEILGSIGIVGAIILVLVAIFVLSGFRIVNQYERGVIFVLGRLRGAKGPGLFWVPPFITQMRKIDLRIITIELPPQEGVTRDNVTVKVSAVVYFYVVNPNDAVNNVLDYYRATVQIAQTTLRNVLGQSELDELLSERERHQPRHTGDHRRAHRALGHQSHRRRGQGRGAAFDDAARDGAPGRGRTREARARAAGAGRVSRPHRRWPTPPRSSPRSQPRFSCATCRR